MVGAAGAAAGGGGLRHAPAVQRALLFEDEAVGLCMRLRHVPLSSCGCFYDWGPCDIITGGVAAPPPAGCGADTNASKLCRLPLTVHPPVTLTSGRRL